MQATRRSIVPHTESPTLSGLTAAQREAVTHTGSPLLVLAGAGSGKTRVITHRVAHLIDQGVPATSILAITFTNKAAGEMAERIEALTGGARVWVSTFHAFGARTLRRFASWIDRTQDFTILDASDQLVAIKEALRETGTDPKLFGAPKVLHAIGTAKDLLKSPADLEQEAASPFETAVAQAYGYYQDLLQQSNALDFSDLLVKTVELLGNDDVREVITHRYRTLLIDEYQDTNHVQYELTRLLAADHRDVCATGDPDQSIYGWRGADIGNILRFQDDYPDARLVKLEENFRSTGLILQAANGLIRHNRERHEKDLYTSGPEGRPVDYRVLNDEWEEARHVARRVQERLLDGVPASDIAVFYRAGALSRAPETAFMERGVPFRVVGSVAFYQRREVKDVLAYLRLVNNPKDDVALQRVINVPPRSVGKTTVRKVRELAREARCSMFEAATELARSKTLRSRSRQGLKTFTEMITELTRYNEREPAVALVLSEILVVSDYRAYLAREYPREEDDRLLNLESLIAGARDFDRRFVPPPTPPRALAPDASDLPLFATAVEPADGDASFDFGANASELPEAPGPEDIESGIAGFLNHTALLTSAEDRDGDDLREKVSLMTIHAAKGLEFDTVFVVGLEEGLFPHNRSLEEGGGLEEERRLAYVAITRAKRRLILTRSNWRSYQGRTSPQRPSVFLLEIPQGVFRAGSSPAETERSFAIVADADADAGLPPDDPYEGVDPPWVEDSGDSSGDSSGESRAPAARTAPRKPKRPWQQTLVSGDAPASAASAVSAVSAVSAPRATKRQRAPDTLANNDRVHHEHFGYGTVINVSGVDHRRRAKIRFDEYGTKDLVLQYARLNKLDS